MKILTGIQPTNILHIGNYFGALKPAVKLSQENDLLMMIADYHAITVPQDPKQLKENILFATAAYIATGIDPKKTVLFQQSQVPEHTELGWILQTLTYMGEAERMTQFKDKSGDNQKRVSVGLFTYPTLMAADILLYNTEAVPVGADQKQHLELTRDLAERFNHQFGKTFVVPEPLIPEHGAKILSLNDPLKKMSKSSPTAKSYVSIMDTPDVIVKKIRSAVTDSERTITVDDNRPGLKNLLTILHLITGESLVDIAGSYEDKGMKELKDDLAEALVLYLGPLQAEIRGLLENKDELQKIIEIGSREAHKLANNQIKIVKNKMGLL
ncbi:tryptophan--tRNA ligase [Candidatus Uhrbacteria bacterium CG_4_10_14_0_2_um_filter_41_7]|uniref:Tryptophan--tRNA ligase n=1 Tax=Candidatus Uhrbacteria bacterium CG_4_9_14_3_um_filter_41_35 TaxID=1975034 RepID=A0A2M7XGF0_9BACT|nr:MAG: tryptophan--tRNA ligase [Candidatus Uhrbacteria bacterium CG11_big_fil_rev_8_21_14_0_20_41_9]PIZ54124.1 MAG: tryptophan--tRNA ligase [Candidatus Uhrbacteria bacterium CG_4_10_14_0_2_um_filter_41_7]PJA46932.1 MAG: tryptophan--tRNA ligase [Candidatus Uhrbacteria bacterium CG_4_9_14_3_um_filter_41_35]